MPVKDVWNQFTLALILRLRETAGRGGGARRGGEEGPLRSAGVPSLFVTQILRFMEIGRGGGGAEIKLMLLSIYSLRLAT